MWITPTAAHRLQEPEARCPSTWQVLSPRCAARSPPPEAALASLPSTDVLLAPGVGSAWHPPTLLKPHQGLGQRCKVEVEQPAAAHRGWPEHEKASSVWSTLSQRLLSASDFRVRASFLWLRAETARGREDQVRPTAPPSH